MWCVNMKYYLAGEIGLLKNKDDAIDWREDMEDFLHRFGHSTINPLRTRGVNLGEIWTKLEELRANFKIEQLRRYVRDGLILEDTQLIRNSDAIVAYIKRYSVGTAAELFFNKLILGQPNYVICDLPVDEWNFWMIGLSSKIFRDIEEFKEYIVTGVGGI